MRDSLNFVWSIQKREFKGVRTLVYTGIYSHENIVSRASSEVCSVVEAEAKISKL
jgi:hypothetical protein